jgi:hypothetical protein
MIESKGRSTLLTYVPRNDLPQNDDLELMRSLSSPAFIQMLPHPEKLKS